MQSKAALSEEKALLLTQRLKSAPYVVIGKKTPESKARDLQKRLESVGLRVELEPVLSLAAKLDELQCPACDKYVVLTAQRQCPACGAYVDKVSSLHVLRKKIEREERKAIENGLAASANREKGLEMARLEKRLREQIRAELMKEMGLDPRRQRQRIFFQAGLALLAAVAFVSAGYGYARYQKGAPPDERTALALARQLTPEEWHREDVLTNQALAATQGLGPQPASSAVELLAASGGEASLAAAPMAEYEASQGGNHAWRDAFRQLPEPQRLQIIGRVANDMARAGQAGRAMQALQSLPDSPGLRALKLGLQAAVLARNPDSRDLAALQTLQRQIQALPGAFERAQAWLAAYRQLSLAQPAFYEQNAAFANEAQAALRDAPAPHKTMLQEQLRIARAEALQSHIAWLARQGRWNEAQRQFEQMRDAAAGTDASAPVQISLLAQHALAARKLGLLREEEELMNRLPVPLSRAMESGQWPAALDALRPWARGGNWPAAPRMQAALRAVREQIDRLPAASKAQALARLALLDYEAGERKQGMETERQFRQALPQAGGAAAEEQVRFLVDSGLVFAERARHAGALAEAEAWLRSVGLVVLR